jgi:hypothetical protein
MHAATQEGMCAGDRAKALWRIRPRIGETRSTFAENAATTRLPGMGRFSIND